MEDSERTVFILGAGASREAGAPLMGDFLDTAERIRRTGRAGKWNAEFDLTFKAIAGLQSALAKSQLDIDNLEAVFAAFEMAELFGRPMGDITGDELKRLVPAMTRVIARTLEATIRYPIKGDKVVPPGAYRRFAALLHALCPPGSSRASIITFNYDTALDYALKCICRKVDYCTSAPGQGIEVMKLHGSLNWSKCEHCGEIIPLGVEGPRVGIDQQTVAIEVTSNFDPNRKHCVDKRCAPEPVIVPPTWNKGTFHRALTVVWRRAAQRLAEAENLIVIGYSLPAADAFFRYLYGLGTISPARIKHFWVFDPDQTGGVGRRFEELLGQLARVRFKKFDAIFGEAVLDLAPELVGCQAGDLVTQAEGFADQHRMDADAV
jgi:NAD-dependent SIR2 family protein deacetylase